MTDTQLQEAEVAYARLKGQPQPAAINLETGVIRIEPEVSKVRMPRLVTIHPKLAV